MQELPTEEKEDYLTRAILLMHNQPMVSIVVVMDVFFYHLSTLDQVGWVSRDMMVGQVPGQGYVGHRPGWVLELDDEVSLHV